MAKQTLQIPAVTRPQITELGPPLGRANDIEAESAVHELRIANPIPNIDKKEKFRSRTGSWPRANSCASS